MLHVEHIHKTFFAGTINEKVALQDLSLHLAPAILLPLSAATARANPHC